MAYRVRAADVRDLETVVSFTLAEAREAERLERDAEVVRRGVRRGLEDPSAASYWVVETDSGEVVGSVSVVREWSDWHAGHYWWIQSMFVTPPFRGQGLMPRLLGAVSAEARRHDAIELRLYVHQGNTPAIRAYERAGFSHAPYRVMRAATEPDCTASDEASDGHLERHSP